MRKIMIAAAWMVATALSACGGGGSGGGDNPPPPSTSAQNTPTMQTPPANSGSNAGTTQIPPPKPPPAVNQIQVVVENYYGIANQLLANVNVCIAGTTNCVWIDDILVDTGSWGLRIQSQWLGGLPLERVTTPDGGMLTECAAFGSGVTYGTVARADVKMVGETAASVPVQIVGDPAASSVPTSCSNRGVQLMNTYDAMHAKGILGIGFNSADCGAGCVTGDPATGAPPVGWYYDCTSATTCTPTLVPLASQVTNPVSAFATDNNGVIIQLPAVAPTGANFVNGTMTFGIGTQPDNALGSAKIFTVGTSGATTGDVTTQYNGATDTMAFLDTGSNGLFFADPGIQQCADGFYCPTSTLNLQAFMQGQNGANATVNFRVGNADSMVAAGSYAIDSYAAAGPTGMFDWGLPFFYGRTVYTAIAGKATPGGTGPYVAF
ncbi:DUF3443 family protein [Paraburkholderia flagellata]|uniref:DUF3443 family protein n=1 Tax=Paraburkholderia flagellata TaxID=2883241 RepID=UPI001F336C1A|nr:DUF3443 family protein [Paraburkholderia flagellata]